jgi:hypothetical protein
MAKTIAEVMQEMVEDNMPPLNDGIPADAPVPQHIYPTYGGIGRGTMPEPKKTYNRHITIALNHLNKRRDALLAKRAELTKEIEEVDAAILALE